MHSANCLGHLKIETEKLRIPDDNEIFRIARDIEYGHQAQLLRDIFGNAFSPITINPSFSTSEVIRLAQQIYDERDFEKMIMLADALEQSGCDDPKILDHCRGPGPHTRGCWVVDLVLGKP